MNFQQMPPSSSLDFCRMCNFSVYSKTNHLKVVHGWVKCKFCYNLMAAHVLNDHVLRKHQQPLKRKRDDDNDAKIQNGKHETDELKAPPNELSVETKRPRLANTPPIQLNDANRNDGNAKSDESKTVAEDNDESPFNNAPESTLAAQKEKSYPNMILVSDRVLNELLAGGRIGCENGKLFLRDS